MRMRTQSSPEGSAGKVLIIDDDDALVRMLRLTLRDGGYHVDSASNGQDALDHLDASQADIIILDLEMPVMDGRMFYRELRARGNYTPVLILSANGARRAYLELGAQSYLQKPFAPRDLLGAVEALCNAP